MRPFSLEVGHVEADARLRSMDGSRNKLTEVLITATSAFEERRRRPELRTDCWETAQ